MVGSFSPPSLFVLFRSSLSILRFGRQDGRQQHNPSLCLINGCLCRKEERRARDCLPKNGERLSRSIGRGPYRIEERRGRTDPRKSSSSSTFCSGKLLTSIADKFDLQKEEEEEATTTFFAELACLSPSPVSLPLYLQVPKQSCFSSSFIFLRACLLGRRRRRDLTDCL